MNLKELARYNGKIGHVDGRTIKGAHIAMHNHPSGNTVTPGKEVTTDEQNALQKFFTDLFSGKKPDETKEEKAKPDAKSN